jgi:hypothetical protein
MDLQPMQPPQDIGTAPPWMRTKPMQVGTTPAPAPDMGMTTMGAGSGGNPGTGDGPAPGFYASGAPMASTGMQFDARGNVIQPPASQLPSASMSPTDLWRQAYGTAPAAPAASAGVNGAARAVPGTDPASPTAGIDIGSQQTWNGGPSVDRTRVGAGGLPNVSTDFSADAQRGADAAYQGATQYMDKDFGRANDALESKLVSQGFAPGSEAFKNEMEMQQRGQNNARTTAALAAQGVGFDQSGQLLARALQTRAQLRGERTDDADRTFAQSLNTANLGLGARGQDLGLQGTKEGAAASVANAGVAAGANQYSTDASTSVALRRLGIDQSNSDYDHLIALINSSRGGVNMPNFGAPQPLDVTGANSIASSNANAAANRSASDRNTLAQLGGAALGSYFGR